ncbi:MAG: diaminopimelate epimerase, partial [Bacteroidota bacterium]
MFANDLSSENVLQLGRQIRFSEEYAEEGVNVNLIMAQGNDTLDIATYERGVENETLSCGTGATACALYYADLQRFNLDNLKVKTKGGELKIYFKRSPQNGFTDVWLRGPAKWVFSGNIEL